jgi:thiamine pyrophosphokinase
MAVIVTGILFTGAEAPDAAKIRKLMAEFSRRSNSEGSLCGQVLVVAADSGLHTAAAAGIRPDWIVGDMDSIDSAELAAYPAEQVLRYPVDKDYTDTELAFSLLEEKGAAEIIIIGGGGGRTDHLFAIRSLFERDNPPARWLTAAEDIRCLCEGETLSIAKRKGFPPVQTNAESQSSGDQVSAEKSPQLVSVFPLGDGPWKAESSGLKWPLAGVSWTRGFFGISNEAVGAFSITALQGRFLVIFAA